MFEKKKIWYIECMTGCTCCSYENFMQGFYDNPEEPQALIDQWNEGKNNPLSSQYAKYGRYKLYETEAEILPYGRWIVDGTLFQPNEVVSPGVICW